MILLMVDSIKIYCPRLWILCIVTCSLNAGCAINVTPWGHVNFGFDNAQLYGKTESSFMLPDGGSVTLRKLNNDYSLKIDRYFRVVSIGPGIKAKILSTSKVGDYSLVWVEKQMGNCVNRCLYSTVLIAIKGFEVKVWEINGEDDVPYITVTPTAAAIDVPGVTSSAKSKRYVFSEGQLYNQGFIDDSQPSYVSAVFSQGAKSRVATDNPSSAQQGRTSNLSKSYVVNKSLVFSTDQKIKPVVIYLDKQ